MCHNKHEAAVIFRLLYIRTLFDLESIDILSNECVSHTLMRRILSMRHWDLVNITSYFIQWNEWFNVEQSVCFRGTLFYNFFVYLNSKWIKVFFFFEFFPGLDLITYLFWYLWFVDQLRASPSQLSVAKMICLIVPLRRSSI